MRGQQPRRPRLPLPLSPLPSGISLIEVLISMFVLLFGLMGVAAIIPVGNYYVVEGEKYDLGAALAQNAFEEIKSRGMLRPEVWLYADDPPATEALIPTVPVPGYPPRFPKVIQDAFGTTFGDFNVTDAMVLPGRAFVIDPMGSATGLADGSANLDVFPYYNVSTDAVNTAMPPQWQTTILNTPALTEDRWPVRRVNLPVPDVAGSFAFTAMNKPVAETIFRLRDDLAVDQPDRDDVPSKQRWDVDDNGTPDDTSDDILLRRQYKGDYSWLATIVPETTGDLQALQPSDRRSGNVHYDVTVVVFRKRDDSPSLQSERIIEAELLPGGELIVYSTTSQAKQEVDAALDDIRAGTWISLMGVNQTTGDFILKWYRILSMDDETAEIFLDHNGNNDLTVQGRRLMLIGPDWPATPSGNTFLPYIANLRAGLLPGAIGAVTKPLLMEKSSLWSTD